MELRSQGRRLYSRTRFVGSGCIPFVALENVYNKARENLTKSRQFREAASSGSEDDFDEDLTCQPACHQDESFLSERFITVIEVIAIKFL